MLDFFNSLLCGFFVPLLLVVFGLYYAYKLNFFYILHPIKAIKSMCNGGMRSLSVALAGTLGVGNIVGVASAIISGGAGAIFWMWISAFLAMSIKYAEVFLAIKHRRKKHTGEFYGGASYYIYDGFKEKYGKHTAFILASLFAILCVINSLTTGNLVQVSSVSALSPFPKEIFGLLFCIIALLIILGGIKRISDFTSVLIPFLTAFYIFLSLFIIFGNISRVPGLFLAIVEDAFSFKCAISGFFGYGISASIRYGVSRGILSNEAGCGTSPTAHASSDTKCIHSQGCLGVFEVFFDTIVLCTLTAFVILLSGIKSSDSMELVISSYQNFCGLLGKYGIIFSSFLFAFATVACQYYYGIEALGFISRKKLFKVIYSIIFITIIFIGAIIPINLMWQISDFAIAFMTIFNLICLFILRKEFT